MIDTEALRNDLMDEGLGAYFGGGFGGGLMEALEVEDLGEKELIQSAHRQGVDLTQYER